MSDSVPAAAQGAVFVSYAREDTASAQRIAEALRSHGVEVWFDQAELRGGDAWDQKIRKQINDCTLFLPIISQNTQARGKGYFRLEWKLAVEQTHLMAEGIAFLAPVVIDDTKESGAVVPPEFLKVQWTRLSGGLPTTQFIDQVKHLLNASLPAGVTAPPMPMRSAPVTPIATPVAPATKSRFPTAIVAAIGVAVLALVAYVALRPGSKEIPVAPAGKPAVAETRTAAETKAPPTPTPATPAVPLAPDKSIAVLPFENLSPDKDYAFFADGVHGDVITNLTKIRDLKVIGRTSVLEFRDPTKRNLKKIAAELGVATVLEGSVQRIGTKVHVTAHLTDARTNQALWAETYDKDLTDVFAIQSTLSREIAAALKANLTVGERASVAERPTENLEAYDLYLRARAIVEGGSVMGRDQNAKAAMEKAIALYEQAVAKDPNFALAYAQLAYLDGRMFWYSYFDPTAPRHERAKAASDAALRLAPGKPETRLARGAYLYYCQNDWAGALAEYRAATALRPNDAQLAYFIGLCHRRLGQPQDAATYFARAMELNPKDSLCAETQLETLALLRRYPEVIELGTRYGSVFPNNAAIPGAIEDARLELHHDVSAYLRSVGHYPTTSTAPADILLNSYAGAIVRGDWATAERLLAETNLTAFNYGWGGVMNEPVALARARVAYMLGKQDEARVFADQAIKYFQSKKWNPRQPGAVMLGTALAHAIAGHGEEAVKLAKEGYAWQASHDGYLEPSAHVWMARVFLVLGLRDEALSALRDLMTGPGLDPEHTRLDPWWARVKDDPRFEEYLKLAKPL